MRFSVQQIKYEFLYAIKEYDGDGGQWQIALADAAPAEMLAAKGLEPDDYLFLGKPASTSRAASAVRDFMVGRCGVNDVTRLDDEKSGDWVVLFRTRSSLPEGTQVVSLS